MHDVITQAIPNSAHKALAKHSIPIITMNIDGLHSKAGSKEVFEVHGNLDFVYCKNCQRKYPFEIVKEDILCKDCNTCLETNVVLYGDAIKHLEQSIKLVESATDILVVGTSFYTSTVNMLVAHGHALGKKIQVINEDAETEVPRLLEYW